MAIVLTVTHNVAENAGIQFEILTTNKGGFMLLYWDSMRKKFIRNADLMLWHESFESALLNLTDLIMLRENGYSLVED